MHTNDEVMPPATAGRTHAGVRSNGMACFGASTNSTQCNSCKDAHKKKKKKSCRQPQAGRTHAGVRSYAIAWSGASKR